MPTPDTSSAWEVVGDSVTGPPPLERGSPWAYAAYELLRQKGSLTFNEILGEVGHLIPPGRAVRETERRRQLRVKRPRVRPVALEEQVRMGRRQMMYDVLRQMTKSTLGQRLFRSTDPNGAIRYTFNPNWKKKPRSKSQPT